MKDPNVYTTKHTVEGRWEREKKETFPNKIKTLDRNGKGEGYGQQR